MAKIQFLTILLTITCFPGGVVSVTDMEFEVCTEQNWIIMYKSSETNIAINFCSKM